jgi:hypothetical protein
MLLTVYHLVDERHITDYVREKLVSIWYTYIKLLTYMYDHS